jgi:hypothetical protein
MPAVAAIAITSKQETIRFNILALLFLLFVMINKFSPFQRYYMKMFNFLLSPPFISISVLRRHQKRINIRYGSTRWKIFLHNSFVDHTPVESGKMVFGRLKMTYKKPVKCAKEKYPAF